MSHVPVPIIKKKAISLRSGRRFRERKYTALFQETVRQFLENKVITHNTTEFITPKGEVINLPIQIQFVNPPLEKQDQKIRELTNSDDFLTFFDRVLDNTEKEIRELSRRRHKVLTGVDLVDIDTDSDAETVVPSDKESETEVVVLSD